MKGWMRVIHDVPVREADGPGRDRASVRGDVPVREADGPGRDRAQGQSLVWSRLFAAVYDRFMYILEKNHLKARRARLISGLSGRIFEVGVGTGVNFEHYKDDVVLIGIEPSPYMLSFAQKRKDISINADRITIHAIGCGNPELDRLIPPGSLDVVVCTLVLCTVPEPGKALASFMRWLKPGGRLVVLEHIRSHGRLAGWMQDAINPFWERIAEGCQLNRSTDTMIPEAGFRLLREERFKLGVPFYEAEFEKPRDQ